MEEGRTSGARMRRRSDAGVEEMEDGVRWRSGAGVCDMANEVEGEGSRLHAEVGEMVDDEVGGRAAGWELGPMLRAGCRRSVAVAAAGLALLLLLLVAWLLALIASLWLM